MTIAESKRHSPGTPAPAGERRTQLATVARRLSGAVKSAGSRAARLIGRVPGTINATRVGAQGTTSALQTLPDPTLRLLAASSVGLGAGFYMARAPRLIIAAGVAPALIMGAAMILRPIKRIVPAEADR
jgi:acyl-CoA reductase-like NAD-dependent aldehyde dehydrogenase